MIKEISPMTIQAILIGKKTELAKQDTLLGFASNLDSIN